MSKHVLLALPINIVFYLVFAVAVADARMEEPVVVKLSVSAERSSYVGPCPATIRFTGKIEADWEPDYYKPHIPPYKPQRPQYTARSVTVKFVRSDGATRPQTVTFKRPGTTTVFSTWKFPSATSGWVRLDAIGVTSNKAPFTIQCKWIDLLPLKKVEYLPDPTTPKSVKLRFTVRNAGQDESSPPLVAVSAFASWYEQGRQVSVKLMKTIPTDCDKVPANDECKTAFNDFGDLLWLSDKTYRITLEVNPIGRDRILETNFWNNKSGDIDCTFPENTPANQPAEAPCKSATSVRRR